MNSKPFFRKLSGFFSLEEPKRSPEQQRTLDLIALLFQKCVDESGGDDLAGVKRFVSLMDRMAMENAEEEPVLAEYFLRVAAEVRSQFSMEKQ